LRALHDMMLVQGMILVGDGHASADAGHHGLLLSGSRLRR